jgi:hypothetical protein
VPSFWVMNKGAAMPESRIAVSKAAIVSRERSARAAFSRPAFSRSRSPMRPRSDEQVMAASGMTAATSSAARLSWLGSSGEKIDEMPTDLSPAAFISCAALVTAVSSSGMNGRPSYSWPPSTIHTPPRTRLARSSGQSQNGGSEAEAGMPSLSAATLVRWRRWTTALMKCVVPIITPSIRFSLPLESFSTPVAARLFSESRMPVVTSSLVGAFTAPATLPSSIRTASVLVPPTSMPMRLMS